MKRSSISRDAMRRLSGFTLVELLVVIGIVSVLTSFLLPALNKARMSAEVVRCAANQRQAFMALALYANDFREYPATGHRAPYENIPGLDDSPMTGTPDEIVERLGYGFGAFTDQGPYQIMKDLGYIKNYRTMQCTAPADDLSPYRNGYIPWGPSWNPALSALYGDALWYGYNGPNVWGPRVGNNGMNGGILWLGGHHPWVIKSWGISARSPRKECFNNYRTGMTSVTEIALLACPGLPTGGWPSTAQREPHADRAQDLADDYGNTGNFQTDGPLWTPPTNWKVRRNYTFGDGHTVYIKRDDRGFTTNDSF